MTFKLVASLVLAAGALSATTDTVQVQSITGGFLAGCTVSGCGGKFLGMINGVVNGDGNMVDGTNVFLYCVDFENHVYIPSQVYTANISTVVNGSDLSNTVYGRTGSAWAPGDPVEATVFTNSNFTDSTGTFIPTSALQRYQMAGWLLSQYTAPNADRNAIEFAIWTALEVTPPAGDANAAFPIVRGKTGTDMNLLLSEAADYVSGPYTAQKNEFFSSLKIVTEVAPIYLDGPDQVQEFMYFNPEPSTLAILVAAVFGILAYLKWRKASLPAQNAPAA